MADFGVNGPESSVNRRDIALGVMYRICNGRASDG
jgi:hypothetical protein